MTAIPSTTHSTQVHNLWTIITFLAQAEKFEKPFFLRADIGTIAGTSVGIRTHITIILCARYCVRCNSYLYVRNKLRRRQMRYADVFVRI